MFILNTCVAVGFVEVEGSEGGKKIHFNLLCIKCVLKFIVAHTNAFFTGKKACK